MTTSISIQEEQPPAASSSRSCGAVEVIPFALRLPLSVFQSVDEAPSSLVMMNPQLSAVLQDTGIVGTITLLRKTILIWFGWGKLVSSSSSGESSSTTSSNGRLHCFHVVAFCRLLLLTPNIHIPGRSIHDASATSFHGSVNDEHATHALPRRLFESW